MVINSAHSTSFICDSKIHNNINGEDQKTMQISWQQIHDDNTRHQLLALITITIISHRYTLTNSDQWFTYQHKRILSHSPGGGHQPPFGYDVANSIFPAIVWQVSWKSVHPFPRTVDSYFVADGKKTKQNQKKSVKHIRIRLIGDCAKDQ